MLLPSSNPKHPSTDLPNRKSSYCVVERSTIQMFKELHLDYHTWEIRWFPSSRADIRGKKGKEEEEKRG